MVSGALLAGVSEFSRRKGIFFSSKRIGAVDETGEHVGARSRVKKQAANRRANPRRGLQKHEAKKGVA